MDPSPDNVTDLAERRRRAQLKVEGSLTSALAAARTAAVEVFFDALQPLVAPGQTVRLMVSAHHADPDAEILAVGTLIFNLDGTEPSDPDDRLAMALGALKAVAPNVYHGMLAGLDVADKLALWREAADAGDVDAEARLKDLELLLIEAAPTTDDHPEPGAES